MKPKLLPTISEKQQAIEEYQRKVRRGEAFLEWDKGSLPCESKSKKKLEGYLFYCFKWSDSPKTSFLSSHYLIRQTIKQKDRVFNTVEDAQDFCENWYKKYRWKQIMKMED